MPSQDDKLHEALVVPRHDRLTLPDSEVEERPGWVQITTPSVRTGMLNEVLLAILQDAEADAVIDRTIARYRALGVSYKWCVGPDSRPTDLAERLERRGLERWMCKVMTRETTPLEAAVPAGVTVEEVDEASLPAYIQTLAAGWDSPLDETERVQRHARTQRPRNLQFLARLDGVPAGAAGYVAHARSAYFVAAVVLPAYRGRGVYRALLDARLRHARAAGLALATTQARESTSAPILERVGFETVGRYPVFGERVRPAAGR